MVAITQVQFLDKVIVCFTGAVVQTVLSVWTDRGYSTVAVFVHRAR